MRCRRLLRLTVAVGLIACNDPSDPGDDARGFRVTALEPGDGATGVPLDSRLSATLSADVQDNTIPISAVRITTGGSTVPSFLSFDPAARRIEVRAPLLPASTYRAVLSAEIRSSTGDSLAGSREWTFSTRPWEPDAIPSIGKFGILDAAFGPDGKVHLIGEGERYFRSGNDVPDTYVKYATCTSPCSSPGNWSRVALDSAWLPGTGMGVKLDASGVVHVVHFSFSPAPAPDFGPPVIRYLTCSADCSSPGSWARTTIDSTPEFTASWALAGLAVSPEGAVHLLSYPATGGPPDLRYGTCAGQCSESGNWSFTAIPVTGYPSGLNPLQLDPFGRVHLLTHIDHVLTHSNCYHLECTSGEGWYSVPIRPANESPVGASMFVDKFGRTHVSYADLNGGFNYALCTGVCTSAESWGAISLDRGGHLGSAIAVNSMAEVTILNPVNVAGELRYLACIDLCLERDNWEMLTVERPDIFQSPSPGAPRLGTGGDGGVQMVYTTTGHDLHYLE